MNEHYQDQLVGLLTLADITFHTIRHRPTLLHSCIVRNVPTAKKWKTTHSWEHKHQAQAHTTEIFGTSGCRIVTAGIPETMQTHTFVGLKAWLVCLGVSALPLGRSSNITFSNCKSNRAIEARRRRGRQGQALHECPQLFLAALHGSPCIQKTASFHKPGCCKRRLHGPLIEIIL